MTDSRRADTKMNTCTTLCCIEALAIIAFLILLYYYTRKRSCELNINELATEPFDTIRKLKSKPRRRYVVLEAIGFKDELKSRKNAIRWLENSLKDIIGEIGLINLGLTIIDYNPKNQRFIIRVYHTRVNSFMGAVGIYNTRSDVKLLVLGITGSIKKARKYLES
jgi:RNase P/RNase MRP subunit POP5